MNTRRKPTLFGRLKQHPLLWNLLLIVASIFALAVAAHFVMQLGTRHGARCKVPDFTGVRLDEALRIAHRSGLQISVNDSLFVPAYEGGIVLDQLPQKGVEVKPDRTIYVTINAFREKLVPVPYVAGLSLRQAKNMLEIAGLEIAELIYRPDIATNYVLEEFCGREQVTETARLEAEFGSGITLYVGVEASNNRTTVPVLVGYTLKQAKSRLWELGLNVGRVVYDEGINLLNQKDACVYGQTPAFDRHVQLGERVDLRLTLDRRKVEEQLARIEDAAQAAAEERLRRERERADSLESAEFLRSLGLGSSDETGEAPASHYDNEGFFD
ncbi:MAG: PASTA domain-containing protein [Alistipes sp.]|nr:PASTA domain-containing protein [Alistipes sp.]